MATTRTVTGIVTKPDGSPWFGATVRFTLTADTYWIGPDETFPIRYVDVVTDSSGAFSIDLVADLVEPYKVKMPDGEEFLIYLPSEDLSDVTIESLRDIYSGVPFSSLPDLQGPPGTPGPIVVERVFSTTTADADPGTGAIRLNNATQSSATQAFIDVLDPTTVDQTTLLDTWDDSTNTVKGHIRIQSTLNNNTYIVGSLTAVTTATGYRKLVFTVVGSSTTNPFANGQSVYVVFSRAGDAGSNATPAGSNTQVQYNKAGVFGGDASLTYNDSTKIFAPPHIVIGAGTAAAGNAPMKFTSGTNLTTPEAGASEYDGAAWYDTPNATSQRAIRPGWHEFRLTVDGSQIGPTIADFFGSNSSISLPATSMWRLEAQLVFQKITDGTVTWTIVNSAANYTSFAAWLEIDSTTGGTGFQTITRANIHSTTSASNAFPATASLTSSPTNHIYMLGATFQMNAAGNIRIRVTSSAGTVLPMPQSFYRIRRMPGNTGNFVA